MYSATDQLRAAGLLESAPNRRYSSYTLTAAGTERAAEIEREIGKPYADWVRLVGRRVTQNSFSSLIQSIYSRFPDYAKHSALVSR